MTGHPQHLDRYSPAIERVLDRWPESSVREVLDAVGDGTAQLFEAGPGGVIITRLIQEPTRLVCLVWLASGELGLLLERYADVEAWARTQGVDTMRIRAAPAGTACCPGSNKRASFSRRGSRDGQGRQQATGQRLQAGLALSRAARPGQQSH